MKNQLKVSVILPVYNVNQYLRQCLNSVLNQTLRDIEVICVDDGSTDESSNILLEYANKDQRLKIVTQANSGAGAARNKGLEIAKGEYLSFLDADDFFELTMLEEAYAKCKELDADFVVFRSDSYNNDSKQYSQCLWTIKEHLLPQKEIFSYKDIKKDVFKVFNGWAWDKLYKRDFILKNGLCFQEQRTTNDLYFVFVALVVAERVALLKNRILAHHRRSISDSLSVTREKSWNCFYHALLALKNKLHDLDIYDELKQSFINYALHFSLWNLNTIQGLTYEKLYNKLRDCYFDELGITDYPEDFFYNKGEYAQYLGIRGMSLAIYLQSRSAKHEESEDMKKRRSLRKFGVLIDWIYRIGRIIGFIPQIILRFIRGCREYGLRHTFQIGKNKIIYKLRRR